MTPEELARQHIDRQLIQAGWVIRDVKAINLSVGLGVAVREFPTNAGPADYVLFIDRQAAGVVEAKPEGTTLSGVHDQSIKYGYNFPDNIPHAQLPLPFTYESTGIETYFTDERDPNPRSRRVFTFHRPETLQEYLNESVTIRGRLRQLPSLLTNGLRQCQVEAITNLDHSFRNARPRALIQMATGSGKTFTAVSFVYRLVKYSKAKRILFLVDRKTLGRQTRGEFAQYITPNDGRKFTELYNVQLLSSNVIDPVNKVCITTIQRLYSMLRGEPIEDDLEELSLYDVTDETIPPKEVVYNPQIPVETFDFIITDECHRSIYNQWRQVLEYFDAFIIGLTATPSKQTFGFFNKNLVMEYNHERAVADRVNVGFEVYRIRTQITEQGSKIDAGFWVAKQDRYTREKRWEQLDEDIVYTKKQLDREVVSVDQIRTVIRTFRDKLSTEIFPGRTEVPKTLIFAKDDAHAENIVQITRQEFDKGNDFCKKITYKTTGDTPENLIASFRNSYNPRIAVTVDMISTGTDIKPLECLLFMRNIKSRLYFEQMIGRGTRVISSTDLVAVTPDTRDKTHFIVVDAVGVTESVKIDSKPLERKHTVPFNKLIQQIAFGARDEDTITSLAGRLSRLNLQLDKEQHKELEDVSGGKSLTTISNQLLDAVDTDVQSEKAKVQFQTDSPSKEQIKQTADELTRDACKVFDDPKFRDKLIELKQRNEQTIDTVSIDNVVSAGYDSDAKKKANVLIKSFREFTQANQDEITALKIIYNQPYDKRHLTYEMIKELAKRMENPPYNLNTDRVWFAFEQLDKDRVRQRGPDKLRPDLIPLIRYGLGKEEQLTPFYQSIDQRFENWLENQHKAGNDFSPEQLEWLKMIKDHIATSVEIEVDDFDSVPFYDRGGLMKAYKVFGDQFNQIIQELNDLSN
ncbi:MAG: DEAD/DEAH box helicase family protein [Candidatus Marinimicrobia bacterium]|nr:DEAD/DEAH box helicase family protein [Candidatus Neomarinimicrobiota bacterium]